MVMVVVVVRMMVMVMVMVMVVVVAMAMAMAMAMAIAMVMVVVVAVVVTIMMVMVVVMVMVGGDDNDGDGGGRGAVDWAGPSVITSSLTVAVMRVTCQGVMHCECPRGECCPQYICAEGLSSIDDFSALEGRLIRIRYISKVCRSNV